MSIVLTPIFLTARKFICGCKITNLFTVWKIYPLPLDINWQVNKNYIGTPETHIGAQWLVIHTDIQSCQRISTAPNRSSDHEIRNDASVAHGDEKRMVLVPKCLWCHKASKLTCCHE